jgi:hypothetical protein
MFNTITLRFYRRLNTCMRARALSLSLSLFRSLSLSLSLKIRPEAVGASASAGRHILHGMLLELVGVVVLGETAVLKAARFLQPIQQWVTELIVSAQGCTFPSLLLLGLNLNRRDLTACLFGRPFSNRCMYHIHGFCHTNTEDSRVGMAADCTPTIVESDGKQGGICSK